MDVFTGSTSLAVKVGGATLSTASRTCTCGIQVVQWIVGTFLVLLVVLLLWGFSTGYYHENHQILISELEFTYRTNVWTEIRFWLENLLKPLAEAARIIIQLSNFWHEINRVVSKFALLKQVDKLPSLSEFIIGTIRDTVTSLSDFVSWFFSNLFVRTIEQLFDEHAPLYIILYRLLVIDFAYIVEIVCVACNLLCVPIRIIAEILSDNSLLCGVHQILNALLNTILELAKLIVITVYRFFVKIEWNPYTIDVTLAAKALKVGVVHAGRFVTRAIQIVICRYVGVVQSNIGGYDYVTDCEIQCQIYCSPIDFDYNRTECLDQCNIDCVEAAKRVKEDDFAEQCKIQFSGITKLGDVLGGLLYVIAHVLGEVIGSVLVFPDIIDGQLVLPIQSLGNMDFQAAFDMLSSPERWYNMSLIMVNGSWVSAGFGPTTYDPQTTTTIYIDELDGATYNCSEPYLRTNVSCLQCRDPLWADSPTKILSVAESMCDIGINLDTVIELGAHMPIFRYLFCSFSSGALHLASQLLRYIINGLLTILRSVQITGQWSDLFAVVKGALHYVGTRANFDGPYKSALYAAEQLGWSIPSFIDIFKMRPLQTVITNVIKVFIEIGYDALLLIGVLANHVLDWLFDEAGEYYITDIWCVDDGGPAAQCLHAKQIANLIRMPRELSVAPPPTSAPTPAPPTTIPGNPIPPDYIRYETCMPLPPLYIPGVNDTADMRIADAICFIVNLNSFLEAFGIDLSALGIEIPELCCLVKNGLRILTDAALFVVEFLLSVPSVDDLKAYIFCYYPDEGICNTFNSIVCDVNPFVQCGCGIAGDEEPGALGLPCVCHGFRGIAILVHDAVLVIIKAIMAFDDRISDLADKVVPILEAFRTLTRTTSSADGLPNIGTMLGCIIDFVMPVAPFQRQWSPRTSCWFLTDYTYVMDMLKEGNELGGFWSPTTRYEMIDAYRYMRREFVIGKLFTAVLGAISEAADIIINLVKIFVKDQWANDLVEFLSGILESVFRLLVGEEGGKSVTPDVDHFSWIFCNDTETLALNTTETYIYCVVMHLPLYPAVNNSLYKRLQQDGLTGLLFPGSPIVYSSYGVLQEAFNTISCLVGNFMTIGQTEGCCNVCEFSSGCGNMQYPYRASTLCIGTILKCLLNSLRYASRFIVDIFRYTLIFLFELFNQQIPYTGPEPGDVGYDPDTDYDTNHDRQWSAGEAIWAVVKSIMGLVFALFQLLAMIVIRVIAEIFNMIFSDSGIGTFFSSIMNAIFQFITDLFNTIRDWFGIVDPINKKRGFRGILSPEELLNSSLPETVLLLRSIRNAPTYFISLFDADTWCYTVVESIASTNRDVPLSDEWWLRTCLSSLMAGRQLHTDYNNNVPENILVNPGVLVDAMRESTRGLLEYSMLRTNNKLYYRLKEDGDLNDFDIMRKRAAKPEIRRPECANHLNGSMPLDLYDVECMEDYIELENPVARTMVKFVFNLTSTLGSTEHTGNVLSRFVDAYTAERKQQTFRSQAANANNLNSYQLQQEDEEQRIQFVVMSIKNYMNSTTTLIDENDWSYKYVRAQYYREQKQQAFNYVRPIVVPKKRGPALHELNMEDNDGHYSMNKIKHFIASDLYTGASDKLKELYKLGQEYAKQVPKAPTSQPKPPVTNANDSFIYKLYIGSRNTVATLGAQSYDNIGTAINKYWAYVKKEMKPKTRDAYENRLQIYEVVSGLHEQYPDAIAGSFILSPDFLACPESESWCRKSQSNLKTKCQSRAKLRSSARTMRTGLGKQAELPELGDIPTLNCAIVDDIIYELVDVINRTWVNPPEKCTPGQYNYRLVEFVYTNSSLWNLLCPVVDFLKPYWEDYLGWFISSSWLDYGCGIDWPKTITRFVSNTNMDISEDYTGLLFILRSMIPLPIIGYCPTKEVIGNCLGMGLWPAVKILLLIFIIISIGLFLSSLLARNITFGFFTSLLSTFATFGIIALAITMFLAYGWTYACITTPAGLFSTLFGIPPAPLIPPQIVDDIQVFLNTTLDGGILCLPPEMLVGGDQSYCSSTTEYMPLKNCQEFGFRDWTSSFRFIFAKLVPRIYVSLNYSILNTLITTWTNTSEPGFDFRTNPSSKAQNYCFWFLLPETLAVAGILFYLGVLVFIGVAYIAGVIADWALVFASVLSAASFITANEEPEVSTLNESYIPR